MEEEILNWGNFFVRVENEKKKFYKYVFICLVKCKKWFKKVVSIVRVIDKSKGVIKYFVRF